VTDYLSFAGERVTAVSLIWSRWGLWSADIALALTTVIPSAASPLVIGDLTLTGTSFRDGLDEGARTARLVGGYGGWRKDVAAQDYRGSSVMASTVLRDAANAVGERIAMDAQDTNLQRFTREAGPASRVLRQVAGASWWIAPDGVTHIGPRPAGKVKGDFVIISSIAKYKGFEIATEALSTWLPGATFVDLDGATQTISSVSITSTNAGKLRLGVLVS
jgi:hypothetical protein